MKLAQGLYALAAVLNLYGIIVDDPTINQFTKPLLMPILIWLVFLWSKGHVTLPRLMLALALVFAWIGDLLLMLQQNADWYFLAGLGSFLVMQLIYCVVFRQSMYGQPKLSIKTTLPVTLLTVAVLVLIIPNAGVLKFPVAIYSICIIAMLTFGLLRANLTNQASFLMVMIGAVLFVISDAIIGINKFMLDVPMAKFWIMLTYIPAQYLIVRGIMNHDRSIVKGDIS